MISEITDYVNKLVNNKKLPYIDVLVKKNHSILYRYFTGYDYKPTGKELLYLYSLTKPITSVCIMQLLEKGELSLDDNVKKFLPEYDNAYILSNNGEKIRIKNDIKIKHLLTMTAGLTYDSEAQPIKELKVKTDNKASTRQMISAFIESPLAFEPATDFLYSLCYDVLGGIIEVVSNKKLSKYVDENIFKPLNMQNSTFDYFSVKDKLLQCYSFNGDKFERADCFYLMKLSDNYESAGGGILGTVEDYSNFADALACGGNAFNGNQIIAKQYIDALATEQVERLAVNNSYTCVQGKDYGYGYGVRVRKTPTSCGIPKGEFGWDGAAGSYVLIDRDNQLSITIGMNILSWPNVFTGEHLKLANLIYKQLI